MAKYIDAERLRTEIEKVYKSEIAPWLSGVSATSAIYDYVLPLIDSLQQEQQIGEEYAIEIGKHTHILRAGSQSDIDNLIRQEKQEQPTPYDEAYLNEKIAKATKSWEGVDVDKFMDEVRGREPEVDLEKEIHSYFNPHGMELQFDRSKGNTILKPEQLIDFARHFFELGLNARKV